MKYFYEYKFLNGGKVGGHNLENIIIKDDFIVLQGVDTLPTQYDDAHEYWSDRLDMREIEYLKIEPMKEAEE